MIYSKILVIAHRCYAFVFFVYYFIKVHVTVFVVCADREIKPWFAYAFLNSLGWRCKGNQRSIYFDGHERADVVQRRIGFLCEIAEYERNMCKYEGADCLQEVSPTLANDERERVLVVHDESTFYSNEDENTMWVEKDRPLSNSVGSVHSSQFLSEKKVDCV